MLHIGVNGGIGSGKSTFLKVWEQLGAHVVYADELAKEVMTNDSELRDEIIRAFGQNAFQKDGSLNRDELSRKAFEEGRISELNALVHPIVYRELDRQKQRAKENGVTVFAHESALLPDPERTDICDVIVCVDAPKEARMHRVIKRDGTGDEQVRSRMDRQHDAGTMRDFADLVIHNDDTIERLKKKAEHVYRELVELEERRS